MNRYQTHYDVPLLDDIHNYFPALLYEPDAFETVGDLLGYVRNQMQQRFDLFSSGQRGYVPLRPRGLRAEVSGGTATAFAAALAAASARAGQAAQAANAQAQHTTTIYTNPNSIDRTRTIIADLAMPSPPRVTRTGEMAAISELLNLILPVPGLAVAAPPNSFMEPVVVRPTQEQIDAGSSLVEIATEGVICPVCQDDVLIATQARELDACGHQFHTGCIETWFRRNVHCPVCRHDIRDRVDDAGNNIQ